MHYLVLGAEVDEDGDIAIFYKQFFSEQELTKKELINLTEVAVAKDIAQERGIHKVEPESKNWVDEEYIDFMKSCCAIELQIDRFFESSSPFNLQEVE
tara:strand:- start:103 stop:396 length:294 start_codon:yes stop_codon:yes gene_type:complete